MMHIGRIHDALVELLLRRVHCDFENCRSFQGEMGSLQNNIHGFWSNKLSSSDCAFVEPRNPISVSNPEHNTAHRKMMGILIS